MKNPVQMLKDIKKLLGVELSNTKEEIVLAQLKLENGTKLESEDFAVGKEVFILTEDERVALPVGKYELEDGRILEVTEEGIIKSIEVKAEEAPEEEVLEEDKYPSRDEFDALKEEIKAIKQIIGEQKEAEKEAEEKEGEIKKETELKELSKPAVNPIKHSPEQKTTEKKLYSQQRTRSTTLDRVMQQIANIKK